MPSPDRLLDRRLRPGHALLEAGRAMADDCRLGESAFMRASGCASEAAYKRMIEGTGRIMQHAHIGFRDVGRTVEAMRTVRDTCATRGVTVDRFGITLDWSMGYPLAMRASAGRGTGIVMNDTGDFARIVNACPAATHFGDFMLGLPGALDNTRAAIAAGVTSIGNLGQYFTFRLPYWDDDVATTEATVTALGLIAAQDAEILVHSNLDDGFAGLFVDMCCSLGMAIIEKYIIEDLTGARLSHCYGHHFSDPLSRLAFHAALRQVNVTPGTMIFGNTVAYRAADAANYASLANYLMADIMALRRWPTGHAINPVPVTENARIPDVDEIIDAQCFATRLAQHAPFYQEMIDWGHVESLSARLVVGGRQFAHDTLAGMAAAGVDIRDPAQLMLAIRRTGPRVLEALYGPGTPAPATGGRTPVVVAQWARELDEMAEAWLETQAPLIARIRAAGGDAPCICVGTSDVHEHGKYLVERALAGLGARIVDGGVSVDPDDLVARAAAGGADVIAVSTYNGVALRYCRDVHAAMAARGMRATLLMGGRLNEIPADSNSGLPVDVTAEIAETGAVACTGLDELTGAIADVLSRASVPVQADPEKTA
ncbi:cobalamin-dependent protein [Komagataeibacter sp. FNDCF1]|uniref:cobalamin-dependent protein n=1 Tax=Komagataeibacter sp. FNDCF1 TaxID=2878681 RepID=UPI001E3E8EFB|nr:cobalamin-dependent protein [Komagataeibacter sp. FNDCF1]MCE2563322.1 cobalamin-dependent protein [Komagataeibacter sp. FNDCF1]